MEMSSSPSPFVPVVLNCNPVPRERICLPLPFRTQILNIGTEWFLARPQRTFENWKAAPTTLRKWQNLHPGSDKPVEFYLTETFDYSTLNLFLMLSNWNSFQEICDGEFDTHSLANFLLPEMVPSWVMDIFEEHHVSLSEPSPPKVPQEVRKFKHNYFPKPDEREEYEAKKVEYKAIKAEYKAAEKQYESDVEQWEEALKELEEEIQNRTDVLTKALESGVWNIRLQGSWSWEDSSRPSLQKPIGVVINGWENVFQIADFARGLDPDYEYLIRGLWFDDNCYLILMDRLDM